MSARKKLEEDFYYKSRLPLTSADFVIAMGKLVENCKHEKTHWLQEIHPDGTFSTVVVKRCFVCGCNLEFLEVDEQFLERLLGDFDKSCEEQKRMQNE